MPPSSPSSAGAGETPIDYIEGASIQFSVVRSFEGNRSEMAEERAHRRLAAILAADVAGYSRLIGADEEGTLARLKALRAERSTLKLPNITAASSRRPA